MPSANPGLMPESQDTQTRGRLTQVSEAGGLLPSLAGSRGPTGLRPTDLGAELLVAASNPVSTKFPRVPQS